MILLVVRKNCYIEYISKGDKYENLLPKEYSNMIRPYLRGLINDQKTPMKADKVINNESQFGEWKIQLVMLNSCISSKNFEETCSIYSASDNTEIFMGIDTDGIIDKLFDTIYKDFKKQEKHQMKDEANLFMKVLVYCIIIFIK